MAMYPEAIWVPGPVEKTGYEGLSTNQCLGVVCHSMVGGYEGAEGRLNNVLDRASWAFSIKQSGEVVQHYDTSRITWHAGTLFWNCRLIGIEHEGGGPRYNGDEDNYSQPLTDRQRDASVKLVKWLANTHGFVLSRSGANKSLYEHNEISNTSCPSNRIPWSVYTSQGGRMYSDEQLDAKFMALYLNAVQNGKDILTLQGQIVAIASAFAGHVQNHSGANIDPAVCADIQANINKLKAELEARFKAAAEVFNS